MMTLLVDSDVTLVCCAALVEMVKWYRPSTNSLFANLPQFLCILDAEKFGDVGSYLR
jgi:hypothetical protein